MKCISVFNNKGGVGKTTLTFHLAHALANLGYKTLLIDFDPQCNLTILSMDEEELHGIWEKEDAFIDDFMRAKSEIGDHAYNEIINETRSIHFLLKPIEDGISDIEIPFHPKNLSKNLDLIPGRLTLHTYEDKIANRWPYLYSSDPLAIRTITKPRKIAVDGAKEKSYDVVIFDTSPSLGILNKVIISTVDGFLIPCAPDMFSLYGIRNIGNSLRLWESQFNQIYKALGTKRDYFPEKFVNLLGYTIYNARKYTNKNNPWNLASAHYDYAKKIPTVINQYIPNTIRSQIDNRLLIEPIGATSVMHSHNTLPNMAQKYHAPIWDVPSVKSLDTDDISTISGNRSAYEATKENYEKLALDLMKRIA